MYLQDLLCEEETELNGRDDIPWTTLEKGTQTEKILVSTEGPLQETYNAAESNNRWVFGGTPCTSAGVSHNNTSGNSNFMGFVFVLKISSTLNLIEMGPP